MRAEQPEWLTAGVDGDDVVTTYPLRADAEPDDGEGIR